MNMLRRPWVPLCVMVLVSIVAAESRADMAEIKKSGRVRVLVNVDVRRPEFFSVSPGSPPGFDQEVLRGFAKVHDIKLEVVTVDGWDALVPALLADKGDVIAGRFTVTDSRRQLIDFTREVFPYRLVVITRKPRPVVRTLEQLRAEKVGTTKGSSLIDALDAAGIPAAKRDDKIPTGAYVEALKSGRVTAVVWGIECAIPSVREDPELQLGMSVGAPGSLAYGVRKGETGLLQALDDQIGSLRRSPVYYSLVRKYFGEDAPQILEKVRNQD
jgi:polar amino acid transport system substrate-binding protein